MIPEFEDKQREQYASICVEYQRLFKLMLNKVFRYSREEPFTLTSGLKSHFYYDCKQVTLDPEGSYLIGEVISDLVLQFGPNRDVHGIGGLTLGADPIGCAVMHAAFRKAYNIKHFIIRKEPKKHGTGKWIEGLVKPHDNVVLVDDVLTTGKSLLRAIQHTKEHQLNIVGVIVLVDREEYGGREYIKRALEYKKPVIALFTRSQLAEALQDQGGVM